ncbi:MAG: tetratricopeptide repeat protein [Chloroflexi bacterium]|nr:tetratricopeptide repeat protein [Chloroflexota bacterium]
MATLRSVLDQARELVINGDLTRARELCTRVLERYPRQAEAHILLAEAARETADYEEARRLFHEALVLDPENGIAYWALGLIAEQQGETAQALTFLERALEYLPGDTELWQTIRRIRHGGRPRLGRGGLARLYLRQGLVRRAYREFVAAVQEQPERLDLRLGLAECLWRLGRYAEARARCEEILAAAPDCLKALLLAVDIYRREHRVATAERLLQRALEIDPDGDLAAALFADSDAPWIQHERVELDEPAVPEPPPEPATWIERLARATGPSAVSTGPRLADWFYQPEEASEAEEITSDVGLDDESLAPWRDLLEATPDADPGSAAALAAALAEFGEMSDTTGDWRELDLTAAGRRGGSVELTSSSSSDTAEGSVRTAPIPAPLSLDLAQEYEQRGEIDLAVSVYAALLEHAPDYLDAIIDRLDTLVAVHPDHREALRLLGAALTRAGRLQHALDAYTRAARITGAHTGIG